MKTKSHLLHFAKRKLGPKCTVETKHIIALAKTDTGAVIAWATNVRGEGKVSEFTFHAEERLVSKLRKIKAVERYKVVDVSVFRLKREGGWGLARPCVDCAKLLASAKIRTVEYTTGHGDGMISSSSYYLWLDSYSNVV